MDGDRLAGRLHERRRPRRGGASQVKRVLALGVEGIKADDGDGYYIPDDAHVCPTGGRVPRRRGPRRPASDVRCSVRSTRSIPVPGCCSGAAAGPVSTPSGTPGAATRRRTSGRCGCSSSRRCGAACSGFSNWSHDVGGYLGHRLVERCPPELLVRWLQFGCFTPLMQAHARMPQEPWNYGERVLDLYRGYVLLHEQLVPYVRAAAATAARTGLPIIRPLCLIDPRDPRGWSITDAYGYGPALWVAPVLDDGAREREVPLPRGEWIETWSGRQCRGARARSSSTRRSSRIPVWVRAGSIIVTYPAAHVARGLGDVPESERPLVATLWGVPRLGRAAARLADGTRIALARRRWSVSRATVRPSVSYRTVARLISTAPNAPAPIVHPVHERRSHLAVVQRSGAGTAPSRAGVDR